MKWGILIAGLIFLLIYVPVGITLIIISPIVWAIQKSNEKKGVGNFKKCPDCAESVRKEATICRFCGHKFEKVETGTPCSKCGEHYPDLSPINDYVCPKCQGQAAGEESRRRVSGESRNEQLEGKS